MRETSTDCRKGNEMKKPKKVVCPTCRLDMTCGARQGASGKDCPQCGQGLSRKAAARVWPKRAASKPTKADRERLRASRKSFREELDRAPSIVLAVGWPMLLVSGAIVIWNRQGGGVILHPRRWRGGKNADVRYRVILEALDE